MILDKSAIMAADDMKRELVEVPEWGGSVYVRMLSGAERDSYEASMLKYGPDGKPVKGQYNMENVRARLVGLCLCDEKGVRLFEDAEIEALGRKSAAALSRVSAVAQKLNGLDTESVAAAEKN